MTTRPTALDTTCDPGVSMGRAAKLLDVRPAFLRSLDTAGVLSPHRTEGGHRRYSALQLARASRLRELLDVGHSLLSATTIQGLEDDLGRSHAERHDAVDARDEARAELRRRDDELDDTRAKLHHAHQRISQLNHRLAEHGDRTPG
ncbi:hypothetical protein GCM10009836_03650 [Pseudonocardia ailaonensis]|uniref:HTH merR-type domain-containing protein n=1 Tax=Pseudonocardia ailaonensis TaxID=367279 RepID=A0ABN2MJG0_9PSEU